MYTTEQVINGIISYADHEVMNMLPTSGKWIVGTGIGLAVTKANMIANELSHNAMVKMLGIINDDGLWDIEPVMKELCNSAHKYGKVNVDIPFVGNLTMSSDDIKLIKEYIEKEA